jgi:hypothetical protein
MALPTGSPDVSARSLPSWANPETSDNIDEVLQALDTYKKKDPSKGMSSSDLLCTYPTTIVFSGSALQSCRERSDNETELLQNHGVKPISSCNPILEEGARMEGWRFARAYHIVV